MRPKKIKSLSIYGKRWHQKTYGNTYHTISIIVNDEHFQSDICYGYENQYKETARKILQENGYNVPNPLEFNTFLQKNKFTTNVVDVPRKKDLL